jgi:hypothetical protein
MLAACGAASMGGQDFAAAPAPDVVVVEKAVAESEESYAPGDYDDEAQVERMVIWNAETSLTVEDVQDSLEAVQRLARELGGYSTHSETWMRDEQLHARITFRVPADRFEDAMSRLRDLALEVNRESASSEDVTNQYVDLESRLRHLEAKEAQLLEFLKEAEDTEAVLAVYEHLAETQAEIEQVKGKMKYLESLSAMATISVELVPEEAELPVIEEGWKPGRTLRDASRSLVKALQGLVDLVIWFGLFVLPVLLVMAIPVVVVVWLVVRWRRRRSREQEPES